MNTLLFLLACLMQEPRTDARTVDPVQPSAATSSASTTPPSKAQADAGARWRDLDRVVLVVNQDVLTSRKIQRAVESAMRDGRITNREEAIARVQRAELLELLRSQGGEDMGVALDQVEQMAKDQLERIIENRNGVAAMAKLMQDGDLSGEELRRDIKRQIYSTTWQRAVTGEGGAVDGRATHDRYVRPGQLLFHYRTLLDRPDGAQVLGGTPSNVRFQTIVLDAARWGGMEKTLELAQSLRTRLQGGEDMNELIEGFSAVRDDQGILTVETARLTMMQPEVRTFLESAQDGEFSAPIPLESSRQPVVRLVRLLSRTQAQVPSLDEFVVQQRISKKAQELLDEWRLERAYRLRLKSSYVWPAEVGQAVADR